MRNNRAKADWRRARVQDWTSGRSRVIWPVHFFPPEHKISDLACLLCTPDNETVFWRDDFCRVIWVDDVHYPGFCRVILNAHSKEMSDLPADQRRRLMDVVFAVELAVREVARPDKINLASLGNVVPHVHWHVIPRWLDDVNFPDAIWAAARRSTSPCVDPSGLKPLLQARIQALLASQE